jgi:Rad3-related DNA helicase
LVLDKRIVSKSYGKYFLGSLPKCNNVSGTAEEIIKELETFFGH